MSKAVKFTNYDVDGIHDWDAPDYCDAYILSATAILEDGSTRDATDEELDTLNEDSELVYELAIERAD